ncbi:GPW/gp25 family protein [Rosenbergiella australiborealis]|uniref:GPW/gp25 family protein n=1 Tax=Rosenbergiella australiborealis TaxID=1544696 RepID=UPI001F4E312C|nr:GPW/gp25 family protein [Rosenbergiella australiborealis]
MQGVDAKTGKRLSGDEHLRQSVIDILTTPKNSRVLLREYGSDIIDLVDNPQDERTRIKIISATASALARWEPRLSVKKIQLTGISAGHFDLTVEGVNTETGQQIIFERLTIYGHQS